MRIALLTVTLLAVVAPAQQPLQINYRSVPDVLQLPPDIYFGEVEV